MNIYSLNAKIKFQLLMPSPSIHFLCELPIPLGLGHFSQQQFRVPLRTVTENIFQEGQSPMPIGKRDCPGFCTEPVVPGGYSFKPEVGILVIWQKCQCHLKPNQKGSWFPTTPSHSPLTRSVSENTETWPPFFSFSWCYRQYPNVLTV